MHSFGLLAFELTGTPASVLRFSPPSLLPPLPALCPPQLRQLLCACIDPYLVSECGRWQRSCVERLSN